jgi:hypothetical protein
MKAFSYCDITQFCIPATVELIGQFCFCGCSQPVNLTFASRSRLTELLDLPPLLANPVNIPDSVEQLVVPTSLLWSGGCVVEFGPGSELAEMTVKSFNEHALRYAHEGLIKRGCCD